MRSRFGLSGALVAVVLIAACVGDDPAASPGLDKGDTDAGTIGPDSPGTSDAGATGQASDGGNTDAQAAPCGYAGETCCAAPFAPCNDGLNCSPQKECVANDLWAVGYVLNFATFKQDGVSAHFNGTSWEVGPSMGSDPNVETIPRAVWGLKPGDYRASTTKGKVLLYSEAPNARWLVCGNFGCSTPNTTNSLVSIWGFSGNDFWIAGVNSMYQCGGATCTAKTAGMPASWGEGTLTGTSSSDLWYSQFDKAFHWDGTSWTTHSSIQARTIWARAKNDVWAGDRTLQHYDGATWSPAYNIEGGAAPGIITSISGTATDDVWAVGYEPSTGSHPAFSAHWDGKAWTLKPLPINAGQMQSVWAVSKKEAYAVSFDGGIFKWDGTAWSAMALPTVDGGTIGYNWQAIAGSARPRP